MTRSIAILALLVAGLMLATPLAAAQGHEQYGTVSGDPRFEQDGAKCREQAAAEESCIVLYAHIFDLLNNVPINIQRVPDQFRDLSKGFSGTPGYEPVWDFNDLTLYSSPGFVEYKLNNLEEKPRLHPERGLAGNIEFGSTPIYGYWYLSADFDEFSPLGVDEVPPGAEDPSVGVMPCLTVAMYIQSGRFWQQGEILTQGKTTKTVVTGTALDGQGNPGVPEHPCPGSNGVVDVDDVVEFEVEMPVPTGGIPQANGYIVYVEWWTHAPGNDQQQEKVYQHHWNLHTGANGEGNEYLSRVVLPVKEPLFIERVRPQFFDGKIYVHGSMNSPWGSYDVDPSTIKIDVFDESGAPVTVGNMDDPILRYSVDHDGHFKPVNSTFVWDFTKDNIAPGTYSLRLSVTNWQHTYTATKEAKITVAEDISKSVATDSDGTETVGDPTRVGDAEESPIGVTPLVLLGVLGLALLALRRRK